MWSPQDTAGWTVGMREIAYLAYSLYRTRRTRNVSHSRYHRFRISVYLAASIFLLIWSVTHLWCVPYIKTRHNRLYGIPVRPYIFLNGTRRRRPFFRFHSFSFSICSSLNTVCVPHPLQSFYGACFPKSILLTLYFCCVGSIPTIRITIGKGVFPHGLQIHTKHLQKI